jgi:THO complex subunit 1
VRPILLGRLLSLPKNFIPPFGLCRGLSQTPPAIFDTTHMTSFKDGMELVLDMFKSIPSMPQTNSNASRGTKRKRGSDAENTQAVSDVFNPKYLTSPELFKLELGDLTFQRHVLVQALILIDFMLSLTPKAKKKSGQIKVQKAMDYSYTLGEQDTQWATKMRSSIISHLADSPDGRFYNRMVENVLSRDKNWLRWKMESCPPIEKPPMQTDDYTKSQTAAKKACTTRRLRPAPMGALKLDFISDLDTADKLRLLTERERPAELPESGLLDAIKSADLELEMEDIVKGPEAWMDALDKRASKSWRALRMARRDRFGRLNYVDESKDLDALLAEPSEPQPEETQEEEVSEVKSESDEAMTNGVDEAEMPSAETEATQPDVEEVQADGVQDVQVDPDEVQADVDAASAVDSAGGPVEPDEVDL